MDSANSKSESPFIFQIKSQEVWFSKLHCVRLGNANSEDQKIKAHWRTDGGNTRSEWRC